MVKLVAISRPLPYKPPDTKQASILPLPYKGLTTAYSGDGDMSDVYLKGVFHCAENCD